jgi:hypothetical protein
MPTGFENRRYRKEISKKRKARVSGKAVILIILTLVVSVGLVMLMIDKPSEEITEPPVVIEEPVEDIPSPTEPNEVVEPVKTVNDANNYIYPYNTMSADWGADVYESGFKYYQLPQKYVNTGGCFPEVVQVYLWCYCCDMDIDYYTVVAMIERESGYKWDATSADGTTKGYMQISDKWHKDRMQAEGVDDIYNPYGNIRVGLNLLQELVGKYGEDYHRVLMSYNMGEAGCKNANNKGIYSTAYSRGILQRAQELKQEIQG